MTERCTVLRMLSPSPRTHSRVANYRNSEISSFTGSSLATSGEHRRLTEVRTEQTDSNAHRPHPQNAERWLEIHTVHNMTPNKHLCSTVGVVVHVPNKCMLLTKQELHTVSIKS